MDDFKWEVSCTEVLGIEPGEQAVIQSFPISVAGFTGTPFIQRAFPCGQWSYTSAA